MKHRYDLVIRNGVMVDGTGAQPGEADVGVKDGVIAAVGRISGRGAEEIDAKKPKSASVGRSPSTNGRRANSTSSASSVSR